MHSQSMAGLPGYLSTLLTRVQLAVDQETQIPFSRAALRHLISQSVYRVASSQVQYPALALVKLHMVGDCSAF